MTAMFFSLVYIKKNEPFVFSNPECLIVYYFQYEQLCKQHYAVQGSAVQRYSKVQLFGCPVYCTVLQFNTLHTPSPVLCNVVCVLGSAVQCSAVQCSAVQCSAVQCSAVQCSAVQSHSAVQCSAVQFRAVQCSAVQSHSPVQSSVMCVLCLRLSSSLWPYS